MKSILVVLIGLNLISVAHAEDIQGAIRGQVRADWSQGSGPNRDQVIDFHMTVANKYSLFGQTNQVAKQTGMGFGDPEYSISTINYYLDLVGQSGVRGAGSIERPRTNQKHMQLLRRDPPVKAKLKASLNNVKVSGEVKAERISTLDAKSKYKENVISFPAIKLGEIEFPKVDSEVVGAYDYGVNSFIWTMKINFGGAQSQMLVVMRWNEATAKANGFYDVSVDFNPPPDVFAKYSHAANLEEEFFSEAPAISGKISYEDTYMDNEDNETVPAASLARIELNSHDATEEQLLFFSRWLSWVLAPISED